MLLKPPNEPERRGPSRVALGIAGVSIAAAGGVWVFRAPLAEMALEAAFRAEGVEAELQVQSLGFSRIVLGPVRLGDGASGGLLAQEVRVDLRWRGLPPQIAAVALERPRLTGSLDGEGLRLGGLERLLQEPDGRTGPAPRLLLRQAEAALETPFGPLQLQGEAEGVLGQQFEADLQWSLGALGGPLQVRGDAQGTRVEARGAAAVLALQGLEAQEARLTLDLQAGEDLSLWRGEAVLEAGQARAEGVRAAGVRVQAQGELRAGAGPAPAWTGGLQLSTQDLKAPMGAARRAEVQATLQGAGAEAQGAWSALVERAALGPAAAAQVTAEGPIALMASGAVEGRARLRAEGLSLALDSAALAAGVAAGPAEPLLRRTAAEVDRAAAAMTANATLTFAHDAKGWRLAVREPVRLAGRGGGVLEFTPGPGGLVLDPGGVFAGAGALRLGGGGLPSLQAEIAKLSRTAAGAWSLEAGLHGALRAGPDALVLQPTQVRASLSPEDQAEAALRGGRLEAQLQGWRLQAPLNLQARFGAERSLALLGDGCAQVQAGAATQSATLAPLSLRLCQTGGALFAQREGGEAAGGLTLAPVQASGAVGDAAFSAALERLAGAWSGRAPALQLEARGLSVQGEEGARLAVDQLEGLLRLQDGLTGGGALSGIAVAAPDLPSEARAGRVRWRLDGVGLQLQDGAALLTAKPEPGEAAPLHEPLQLFGLQAALEGGVLRGGAQVRLAEGGADLGAARFTHDLARGQGALTYDSGRIQFGAALQPYDLTRRLLGVADLARGPIALEAAAAWGPEGVDTSGAVRFEGLSFATLALGPVQGVKGVLALDDLALLTSPPGQVLTVEEINPGLAARQGVLRLQLLPELTVRLEDARFPFAGGRLSVDPTTIVFGGEETRLRLRLTEVDLGALLAEFNLQDQITATGSVTGEFPLVFTPEGGRVEGGRLTALAPGLIAAQSPVVDEAAANAASSSASFLQALQGFRYDELALVSLDGELDGDLTAELRFSGENIAPVELPSLAGRQRLSGLPFRFNVQVRAPITGLVRSAQQAFDYRTALSSAAGQPEPAETAPKTPDPPQ